MAVPWDHEARLLRTTAAGEEMVATGPLGELVAAFLDRTPAEQDRLVLRASGPDWVREWNAAEVRALAAPSEAAAAPG